MGADAFWLHWGEGGFSASKSLLLGRATAEAQQAIQSGGIVWDFHLRAEHSAGPRVVGYERAEECGRHYVRAVRPTVPHAVGLDAVLG